MGKEAFPCLTDPQTGLNLCEMASSVMDREVPMDQMVLIQLARKNNYNLLPHHVHSGADINWVDSMDRSAAHWAAACGSYEALVQMIKLGADVEKSDKYGMTPLLWAAWFGHSRCTIKLTKVYKEKVVCRNKQRMTMLHCAAANDQEHIVEFIGDCLDGFKINAKDIYGMTALHMAADRGLEAIVKRLLTYRPKVDAVDKMGCIPLHYGCKNGNLSVVKALLNAASPPSSKNKDGLTPLHYAVISHKIHVVRKLLKRLSAAQLNMGSNTGETALMTAATTGHKEIFILLLRHPLIDANAQDKNGNTTCHLCCRGTAKNAAIVSSLLNSCKADINIYNEGRELAIHSAIQYNEFRIVSMLIQAGSSLYVNTKYGNSALSLALKSGDETSVDAIIKGQRVHQLSNNRNYFKENFKPQPFEELDLSDDSDFEGDDEKKKNKDSKKRRKNESDSTESDDDTSTILDDSEHLDKSSEFDDLDQALRDELVRTTVGGEDKTSDVQEDYRGQCRLLSESEKSRRKSMISAVSSVSSVSYSSIEEMQQVKQQLLKNLSYLKEHSELVAKNMESFERLESAEVGQKFQNDLKTALREEEPWTGDGFSTNGSSLQETVSRSGTGEVDDENSSKDEDFSMYGDSMNGSIDESIFNPFDQISISSEDAKPQTDKEEDEALMRRMKAVMWKVAYKKMKKGEWIKLAKHWEFPEEHIHAIQYPISKSSSHYKKHSYRLMSIWLDCYRLLKPEESPVREVHEAFSAIEKQALADQILKKMHKGDLKKGCLIS